MIDLLTMESRKLSEVKAIVESWAVQRHDYQSFGLLHMNQFITAHNDRTRQLIAVCQNQYAADWQDLARVAETCQWITEGTPSLPDMFMMKRANDVLLRFAVLQHQFWSAFVELAVNAATLTTPGARIIADGVDRTNL